MLIAARNAMMAGGKLSAKSYVQDGLVAMWDGIENVRWGVHDASATVWTDLVGGRVSHSFSSSEIVEDNAVITQSSKLVLVDDFEAEANAISVLTVQRVAQEVVQGSSNAAASGVNVCSKRFGTTMYFRHVSLTLDNGYGCGPMGFSFAPYFGCFGKGRYIPSDTYPLQSRTMVVGANNNPIAAYEGTTQLAPWGRGLTWGSASTDTEVSIAVGPGGRYRNCCIRVYSRALTADEIAANYAVDKTRFNLP